jgi:trimeric autotransporter adhesin
MQRTLPSAFRFLRSTLISIGLASMALSVTAAPPPAGTVIGNQAAATYTDASLISRSATSNTVTTTVQQVASFTLTATQSKLAAPGAPVSFAHTITNTGNGPDTFTFAATNNAAGDNFNLTSLAIYADADCNGVADNVTPITSIGPIAANAQSCVVVSGVVPVTALSAETGVVTLNANSQFTPAITQANTDTVVVTANAVVSVSKAVSVPSGNPGSGPYTYTLTYTNTGNGAATNVVLADVIPAGMSYVAGSARWSGSGVTALTDAALPADPAGITYDFNVTAAGALTAVVNTVSANSSGTLTFQVSVGAATPPGLINNTAKLCYNDGSAQQPAGCTPANTTTTGANSNTTPFTVNQIAAVNANGSGTNSAAVTNATPVASAPQGSTVSFNNVIWNLGNGADSFDITVAALGSGGNNFPAGTTFQLYKADGVTPLVDTDGTGTSDTGAIPAANNASCLIASGYVQDTTNNRCGYTVVLKATLPAGATGGPYSVTKTAVSKFDSTKTDPVTDTLNAITSSTVDLRNGTANTAGTGAGPEASPVTTQTVNPGANTAFVLKVNNTSTVADNYDLTASTDNTFATTVLPSGWTVSFRADAGAGDCTTLGAAISNTGTVNAGGIATVCAVVSVPAGAPASPAPGVSVFFRILSAATGAQDRKHDAVVINTLRNLTITNNNTGQIFPGGSVVYTHMMANNGNVNEGVTSGQVVLTDVLSGATAGWSAIVYWDKNNDGTLDVTDPIITDLSQLTGGTGGASTAAGLTPGENARLFVKVLAPASAVVGDVDTATLTATVTGVINGIAAPSAVTATDTTTVIAGQVRLVKEHALDANCDGTPDTAYTQGSISTGAVPGACLRYRITATNEGTANATSLVVSDATPANTTYHSGAGAAPAATSVGTITAPAVAASGTVQATIGVLAPNATAVVTFGVRINQ